MLLQQYPDVEFDLGGSTKEENTLMMRTLIGFAAALFLIYGLLAVPLRSYVQPLVIMSVIPFGFIGAVVGHILFDISLNMLSILGLVALAGVVVNDSLILVEFANRRRSDGMSIDDSLMFAGQQRFRAIVLTTLTTFVGLLPMLFETSMQAQFVIPMAISLSFGIVFATTMTLILVPCCYRIVYDIKNAMIARMAFIRAKLFSD
jgi:multidrug efflux pump subunit AcrB